MASDTRYKIDRPVYSCDTLKEQFTEVPVKHHFFPHINCKSSCRNVSTSGILSRIFPFPFIMASFYSYKYLLYDLIAGMTMLVFHIPQGMAYGLLTGLQPINGLYSSFFPPLIYMLFGTSRHLSVGTFSIVSILLSVPVIREANRTMTDRIENAVNETFVDSVEFDELKLQVAISTTLLAGIMQLIMGIVRLGCVMNYLSDALIAGFTTATAIHVIVSQLTDLLGYKVQRYSGIGELPYKLYLIMASIRKLHWVTFGISVGGILILILFSEFINTKFQNRFKFLLPIQLFLVIIGILLSYYLSLSTKYAVRIIGPIPLGLPKPILPSFIYWPKVLVDAALLALFSFVMNVALMKTFALRYSYDVNFNQELVAAGLSNVFSSCFQCFVTCGSMSRSSVVVDVGMKSQLASLVSCIGMLFVLLFVGPIFKHVPTCILSVIIIVSLKGMLLQFKILPKLYHLCKYDFDIWIFSFIATIFLDVPFGFVFGFVFSLFTIIIRLKNPKAQILGQLPETDIYKNIKVFNDAVQLPGIKIFRYDAPLYFANSENFQMKLYKKCGLDPRAIKSDSKNTKPDSVNEGEQTPLIKQEIVKEKPLVKLMNFFSQTIVDAKPKDVTGDLKYIIIDFGSVNYIDNVAIRILIDVCISYKLLGVTVLFATPNQRVRKMILKSEFSKFEDIKSMMFVTIHDAVLSTYTNFSEFAK